MSSRSFTFPSPNFSGFDNPPIDFDKPLNEFHSIFNSALITSLVGSLLSFGATVAVVYLVYRCLKEHGLPSINIKTTGSRGGGSSAGTAELTPLLPDSAIRGTTIENFLNEIAREKPIQFTSEQLDRYTQQRSAELGAGGYGVVYKGMLPNGLDIAVKFLHDHMGTEATEQQFMAEMGTLWRTNHANLIRLIGFCFDAGGRALVYEFMSKKSLDKYLFDRRHRVSPAALLAVGVGVAKGLRYLHEECQKKIIHYDVKPGNVLLGDGEGEESLTPKLTDFGIAQLLSRADTHASVHGLRGTVGYMAPEVINGGGTSPVTEKCDVYSFGMLLFEVIGRRKNMDNGDEVEEDHRWLPLLAWNKFDNGELMDLVKEWHSVSDVVDDEQRWKETAERMCKVAFLCVQERPEARPTMSMVVNMLQGYLDIPAPVYPFAWMYPAEATRSGSTSSSSSSSDVIISIDT